MIGKVFNVFGRKAQKENQSDETNKLRENQTSAATTPIDKIQNFDRVTQALEGIIERQKTLAAGDMEASAVYISRKIVRIHTNQFAETIDLDAILADMEGAKRRFRWSYPDDRGHGARTFEAIINGIFKLQDSLGLSENFTSKSLSEINTEKYSDGPYGYYLITSPFEDEVINAYREEDYDGCIEKCQKWINVIPSQDRQYLALRVLLIAIMRARGYKAALETYNGLVINNNEKEYFDAALGKIKPELTSNTNNNKSIFAEMNAKACFWYGAYLKSIGDKKTSQYLQKCVDVNFDNLETVLARIDLNLPLA